ncbi:MAG: methyltransferase domain-containing protein [Bryobacterales bacterium]
MSTAPFLAPPEVSSATPAGIAFDRIAPHYDEDFTNSLIGRLQREHVWRHIDGLFAPGARVLDLGCGTGADAIHLARRGCQVHAVDASGQMIAEARRKAAAAGLADITWDRQSCLSTQRQAQQSAPPAEQRSVQPSAQPLANAASKENRQDCLSHYDGALSNFGVLNCVEHLRPVATSLSALIRPGGHLALCFISRFCLWETVAYCVQGRPAKAVRRWSNQGRASASLKGSAPFPVYYHSVREIISAFEPEFQLTSYGGIGILVPPCYLEARANRMPGLTKLAARIDQVISAWPICRAVADHALLVFTRGPQP